MNCDTVITNGLLVYPEKIIRKDLGISGGFIKGIDEPGRIKGDIVVDADGCYVLPGIIDPHMHPVYLDDLGGISKTAAYGGVTTAVHYAYAKPGTSLVEVIEQYIEEADMKSCIDFALHGTLFETRKQAEEIPQVFKLGVTSFKMFMAYAKLGWNTDDYALAMAMDIIGKQGGMACLHAENGLVIDYIQDRMLEENADFALRFPETSPDLAEAEAVFRAVYIGRLMNCPVYIPHISSEEAIEVIRNLRQRRIHVYTETCPQYLDLTWNELKSRGPLGKVGPSIKTKKDQNALWKAVKEGYIDTLGSDHAPKDKKPGDDFFKAAYGSPEVETMLPVVWQRGVNCGLLSPCDIARIMSENTARILGLFPKKGILSPGSDADMVIFNPAEKWRVSISNQHSNALYTLFEGKEILGRISKVIAGGRLIVDKDDFNGRPGAGSFVPTKAGIWK